MEPGEEPGTSPLAATATAPGPEAKDRLVRAVVAGHRGDAEAARPALMDPDPSVRSAALGALARAGGLGVAEVVTALSDEAAVVRRRACEVATPLGGPGSRSALPAALRRALADPDPLVVEAACWALGERRVRGAVEELVAVAGSHADARCREAAVGALGALADPAGLVGVLQALDDKATVRRRAAVALAAFEGPLVDAALQRCLEDRDWQVRQAAEILLEP